MARKTGKKGKDSSNLRVAQVYAPTRKISGGFVDLTEDKPKKKSISSNDIMYKPAENKNSKNKTFKSKTSGGGNIAGKSANKSTVYKPTTVKNANKPERIDGMHRLEHVEREVYKNEKRNIKRQKKRMDSKTILNIIIMLLLLVVALAAGYFIFLVDEIVVEGNENYSGESIVGLSGLKTDTHMLFVSKKDTKANIESNPYIKLNNLEKQLPGTIILNITERKEAAVFPMRDYDVIIDIEGHVLYIGPDKGNDGLIYIYGMSQMGFQLNNQIGPASDVQAQALLELLKELNDNGMLEFVKEMNLSNSLRMTLLLNSGITVVIGQPTDIASKISWMKDTLVSLERSGINSGTLDVSVKDSSIYSPPGKSTYEHEQSIIGDDDEDETDNTATGTDENDDDVDTGDDTPSG